VRKFRVAKGFSQARLAEECQRKGWDASREIINHIEMQIRLVRDYEIVALAIVLEVSPVDLLPSRQEAFHRLADRK